jgi:hypothetical protein
VAAARLRQSDHPLQRSACQHIARKIFPFKLGGQLLMATPPRRRVKFADVAIGERFFDLVSAEYFVKQSDKLAAMVTGIGDGTVADEFEADDIVGIDLH